MYYMYIYSINQIILSCRDLQAVPALRDLLVDQVLGDLMVLMENQGMMVNKENEDLQVIQESALIYQDPLVDLDKKETEEQQESPVLLVEMVILELKVLKEYAANMHHLASLAIPVNQENLVKMVNQEHQEHLVGKDRKAKLLDWKKLKKKLKMASNLFVHNYVTVVSEMVIHISMVSVLMMKMTHVKSGIHLMMMLLHVHHMERYEFIVLNLYTESLYLIL